MTRDTSQDTPPKAISMVFAVNASSSASSSGSAGIAPSLSHVAKWCATSSRNLS
jgi:hypothetical protein